MPYLGELVQANGYSITASNCETKVAITVFNIRRDRISEVETIVLTPDPVTKTATTGPRTIGTNVGRVSISASTLGGTATLTIAGAQVMVAPDATITFDVI